MLFKSNIFNKNKKKVLYKSKHGNTVLFYSAGCEDKDHELYGNPDALTLSYTALGSILGTEIILEQELITRIFNFDIDEDYGIPTTDKI